MVASEADAKGKLGEAKEIKVKIPLDFHIKLHTIKVLRGQSISDTVETALKRYFAEYQSDKEHQHYHEVTQQAISAFHS